MNGSTDGNLRWNIVPVSVLVIWVELKLHEPYIFRIFLGLLMRVIQNSVPRIKFGEKTKRRIEEASVMG